MNIIIYGKGCARCTALYETIAQLTADRPDINISKETSLEAMMDKGIVSTPAVEMDGVIKCSGRIPGRDELALWINGK